MTAAIVFLGPTLPAREAEEALDYVVLPPARQGDVYRTVRDSRPLVIGLVDGAFLDERSVWHREIVWALAQGVTVFGAASMGALRAAELDVFGMRGIGRVYESYCRGCWPGFDPPFEDDDEIAVIHAPPEVGGGPLSDAMVDLRDTLVAAEQAAVLDRAGRDGLAAAMKRLHFPRRSFAELAAEGARLLDAATATRFADFLKSGRVARKRLDALDMLEAMGAFLREGASPSRPDFAFERALVWEHFVAAAEEDDRHDAAAAAVLNELRLDPALWRRTMRAATGRLLPPAHSGNLAAELDRFRRERGLWQRADLDSWMAANGVNELGLARLLRQEAALESLLPPPGLTTAMIDHLRLTGQFASLLQRAIAKQAALAGSMRGRPGPNEARRAMDWYLQERVGMIGPSEDLLRHWPDRARFEAAVWAEYVFIGPEDAT